MASKKKSAGDLAPLRKALSGLERTQRELQLNIKNLKTAMGHIHKASGQGHPHGAGSGKGTPARCSLRKNEGARALAIGDG